jgi:L-asparaginase / beta-aspartyl-peptidase
MQSVAPCVETVFSTLYLPLGERNPLTSRQFTPARSIDYHIPVTQQPTHSPTLLVHGGAWAIPADAAEAHESGVRKALHAGFEILSRAGSALDAVEAAVTILEDDPAFDAGTGSFLTSDGRVQLDALLMDGGRMKAGGVACVERLRNPIRAARLVLESSAHVYFVGTGAEEFAHAHGMELIENSALVLDRERERLAQAQARQAAGFADRTFSGLPPDDKSPETAFGSDAEATGSASHDTVGAVALDGRGNLAAATSTGGTLNKTPGRVGDSSLIGCGCYADNLSAAVSVTGWGEPIMKLVLGKWATDRVAAGTAPEIAAREAISYLYNRLGGHGGIILLGPDGRFGLAHNTPAMAWGLATPSGMHTGLTL